MRARGGNCEHTVSRVHGVVEYKRKAARDTARSPICHLLLRSIMEIRRDTRNLGRRSEGLASKKCPQRKGSGFSVVWGTLKPDPPSVGRVKSLRQYKTPGPFLSTRAAPLPAARQPVRPCRADAHRVGSTQWWPSASSFELSKTAPAGSTCSSGTARRGSRKSSSETPSRLEPHLASNHARAARQAAHLSCCSRP